MNRDLNHKVVVLLLAAGPVALAGCVRGQAPAAESLNYSQRQALTDREQEAADTPPGPLARAGRLASFVFVETPMWAWQRFTNTAPLDYALLLESPSPTERQTALLNLAAQDFATTDDYVTVYKAAATNDSDPLVRAAGVRALNLARADTPEVFRDALASPERPIRLEAAKALVNRPDSAATAKLLELAENGTESPDVRIAAADALRHYPDLDVARRLANLLDDRDFGVAFQAAESLNYLTGQDFTYQPAPWLTYLSEAERPFG